MKINKKVLCTYLSVFFLCINLSYCQWPQVEKMIKSHYLPSLEVKIHPPDEYQPKVQAAIAKLESEREKTERKLMQTIEKDYNAELSAAATKISKTIKEALSIFDNKDLLNKSAEYAINPPMIVTSQPKFRQVADFSMTSLQKDTLKALVDDDDKVDKFRKLKMDVDLGENILEKPKDENIEKNITYELKNGPIDSNISDYDILNMPLDFDGISSSFLELKQEGKYSKPISVVMKLPAEPDGSIKTEIDKLEKSRVDKEKKMFTKAKEEFKLITQITVKELQMNLSHELIPFYAVSKGDLSKLKEIITKNFPKSKEAAKSKFKEISSETNLNTNNKITENLNSEKTNVEVKDKIKPITNSVNFDLDNCLDMKSKFKELNLNCDNLDSDFKELSSFLQVEEKMTSTNKANLRNKTKETSKTETKVAAKGADEDFLNIKFSAAEESYPTIEKLTAQMFTRRDLAEKFERLKILEFETNLQKAENEMIQDLLHEELYRIMAKYGPAIEGIKEHVK